MICVLPVLLLLIGCGLANPIKGRQVNNSESALQETVKEMQKSIQVLYNKLKVVESQLMVNMAGMGPWIECRTYRDKEMGPSILDRNEST